MEAVMKPNSPGPISSTFSIFGVNTPVRSTGYFAPVPIMRMVWPFFSTPSMTRTRTMTPR
jgi:hypothetical protein